MIKKWWKRRKDIKRMNEILNILKNAIFALRDVRDETIIPNITDKYSIENIIEEIFYVTYEIDREIDDRTRERESLFIEEKDTEK